MAKGPILPMLQDEFKIVKLLKIQTYTNVHCFASKECYLEISSILQWGGYILDDFRPKCKGVD